MIFETKNPSPFLLKSQPNFRDMGGILTVDGKKIRPGLIFRSGDLHSLADEDIMTLEQNGLSTVIDFRSEREREWRPQKTIRSVKKVYKLIIPDVVREIATGYLEQNNLTGLESLLIDEYRRMVSENRREFSDFLSLLAGTAGLPLVFHCAAGKDRTGLAAIFFLTALGVSKEVAIKDYYATNSYIAAYTDKIVGKIKERGLNGEIMRPLLEVRPEYLNAAMDVIDTQFGGLNEYVVSELKADIERLRKRFLE